MKIIANATVSSLGQVNKGGATDALFLKVFSGEVLGSFYANCVMNDKVLNRNISSGKSATFPAVGKSSAAIHTPGTEIVGTQIGANEVVITIDGLLLSSAFIASIDDAMNHFDVRSYYTEAIGQALAQTYDQYALQEALLGARTSTPIITGNPAGVVYQDANLNSGTLATKASAIALGIFTAAKQLDVNNSTVGTRYCFLRPAEYYALIQGKDAVNRDWAGAMSGGWAEGTVTKLAGIEIVLTNNLPSTNIVTTPHAVDGTKTYGLVSVQNAVGCVKLMDISTETQWDIRRQGTLIVSKGAVGFKALRPEGLVELAIP